MFENYSDIALMTQSNLMLQYADALSAPAKDHSHQRAARFFKRSSQDGRPLFQMQSSATRIHRRDGTCLLPLKAFLARYEIAAFREGKNKMYQIRPPASSL